MKMSLKRWAAVTLLAGAAMAMPSAAQAALLTPPTDTALATSNNGAAVGVLVVQTAGGLMDSSLSGALDTTTWAAVYRNASGFLDFYYQVRNDSTSTVNMTRVTHFDFAPAGEIDVYYRTDGNLINAMFTAGGVIPFQDATQNSDLSMGTVGFDFLGPTVAPGQRTAVMVIKTQLTRFTDGVTSGIDGGVTEVPTFAPAAPEPASLALLGLGFVAAGLRARRRK